MARPLNPKQLKFVERYLATGNATQSYIDAGYGGSRKAAEANAARLIRDDRVQQLLAPAREAAEVARTQTVSNIEITRDRIRLEMARLSFVNPKALYRPDGTLKPIHELDDDTAAAVASVEVEERFEDDNDGVTVRTKKIKFWDKNKALSNLADTEPGVWAEDAKGRGAGGVNVTVNLAKLSDDDLERLDTILAQAAPPLVLAPADAGASPSGEGPPPAQ